MQWSPSMSSVERFAERCNGLFGGASAGVVDHVVARIRRTPFRQPSKQVELVLPPVSFPLALSVFNDFEGIDAKSVIDLSRRARRQ